MKTPLEPVYDADKLSTLLIGRFTVGETQPEILFEGPLDKPVSVCVDFPVPCEPRSQTAIRLSLPEAMRICRRG